MMTRQVIFLGQSSLWSFRVMKAGLRAMHSIRSSSSRLLAISACKARKAVISVFKKEGLRVTAECSDSRVDFLDMELDLQSGNTKPFIKPNSNTKYVSTKSSHPPAIIRGIPAIVEMRLSNLSSNEEQFQQDVQYYQDAMTSAGHEAQLAYKPPDDQPAKPKKNRNRKAIWFNPPWSSNVRTNIAGKFISLVRKHFPESSPLYSIFNVKKIKVSYRTMPNMISLIKSHNNAVLNNDQTEKPAKRCNCRAGVQNCPFGGFCQDKNMIYKADVTTSSGSHHYYGQTFRTFKQRIYGHNYEIRHKEVDGSTLSKHIWRLKDKGEDYQIHWSKVKNAKPYSLGAFRCNLCLEEKTTIARDRTGRMINKRKEIFNKCRHKDEFLLENC